MNQNSLLQNNFTLKCLNHQNIQAKYFCKLPQCQQHRIFCQQCINHFHQQHPDQINQISQLFLLLDEKSQQAEKFLQQYFNQFKSLQEHFNVTIKGLRYIFGGFSNDLLDLDQNQIIQFLDQLITFDEINQLYRNQVENKLLKVLDILNQIFQKLPLQDIAYRMPQQLALQQQKYQNFGQKNNILLGLHLKEQGLYNEAITQFDRILEISPYNIKIMFEKGECLNFNDQIIQLMKQNQEYEAYLKFKEIIFLDPKHELALCRIGNYLLNCTKYDEAKEYFAKCLCINQNNYEALLGFADTLRIQNQFILANYNYEKAINVNPQNFQAFYGNGECLKSLNDFENSQKMFKKALMLNQNHFESLFSLADSLKINHQYQEAITYFDQALQIKPHLSELWEGKATCLRQLNDNEQAVDCYERALKYDPTSYEALKGMGLSLRYLFKCDESIVFFEKALEIKPNNEFSLKGKAECLRLQGKWEEALKYYKMVLYFNPGQHRALFFKTQLEQIISTLKQHEKELVINPKSVNSIFGKAECLRMLNDYDGAMLIYVDVLKIDPNHINSLIGYGFCLGLQNKFEQAMEQYDKALNINQYSTDALWGKGECLRMLMDFNNALTYYEKVLMLYPNHYVSLSGKGDCLRMLNLYQYALEVYNQALFIQNSQPSLLYGKAICLMAQNDFESASELLKQAKRIAPPNFYLDKAINSIKIN
ncbi:unnamed protein product [Paramecium pentaurelia]|uniref:Tetratricopeptide repeat protein n=1 Tax=Paramecium pentaurelia TaxID=43138 RepID=A0A8S1X4I4_9CILI|nr:unnamed protein product [Paramecium pentaurelia]